MDLGFRCVPCLTICVHGGLCFILPSSWSKCIMPIFSPKSGFKPVKVLAYTFMGKNLSLFCGANLANCLPFVMQFMDNPAQLLMNHPAQLTMNSRSFTSTTARWEWNYIIIHWRGVVEFGWELWSAELNEATLGTIFSEAESYLFCTSIHIHQVLG